MTEEIGSNPNRISVLAPKSGPKEIDTQMRLLDLEVAKGELAPSIAQLAISAIVPPQLEAPKV